MHGAGRSTSREGAGHQSVLVIAVMGFGLGAGRQVTVIGAGFSGLVSAYALVRSGYKVTVLESASKPGGLLQTLRLKEGLVETAANALLNSPAVEEMFAAIDVPMIGTLRSARKRYIFRKGRGRRWPLGFFASFRVAGFLFRYFFARASVSPRSNETARSWASRVMGEEASHYLVEAALQGIYAGDPSRLSASLIFARMFRSRRDDVFTSAGFGAPPSQSLISHTPPNRLPKKKHSELRGSVTAPEGMSQIIEGLESYLKKNGVHVHYDTKVSFNEAPLHPHVVAVQGHAVADLLAVISPRRAAIAKRIEFSPVATTTVFFSGTDDKTKGFGVLFPPVEQRRALGVLKNNFIFPDRAEAGFSETWIVGGALASSFVVDENEETMLKRILSERKDSFGVEDTVLASKTTRWPRGIPHYTVELENEIAGLQGVEGNVILMGNYLGEIGLAKILDRALRLPLQLSQEGRWSKSL